MHRPVLGVVGGVGPLATAYFMELVIKKTPAERDQDNIPMIVYNDPQIPDRTSYILDKSNPDPLPEMLKVVRWLEDAGADYIAIPCNTAHYFYDAVAAEATVPVLNIIQETTRRIYNTVGSGKTVGILATDGTIQAGVFQSQLEADGFKTAVPSPEDQRDVVMSLIYDRVKKGLPYDSQPLLDLAARMHAEGCDVVIVGCTELSVIYQDLPWKPNYLIDSMDVLADRCVGWYTEQRKLLAMRKGGRLER